MESERFIGKFNESESCKEKGIFKKMESESFIGSSMKVKVEASMKKRILVSSIHKQLGSQSNCLGRRYQAFCPPAGMEKVSF